MAQGTYEVREKEADVAGHASEEVSTSIHTTKDSIVDDGLPPQDRGRGAWMFLFGAAIVEIGAWGFPYTYGVFRAYFYNNPPFEGEAIISTVGVLDNGTLQLVLPPIIYFLNFYPQHRKNVMWLGNLICCLAPIGGGLSKTTGSLMGTLGVLYGIGAGMLFAPSIHLMNDWFNKRKSLAYGVICGAGAAAGAALPPIYAVCLQKFGYKATLIGWGLCSLVMTTAGLFCIQPRVPPVTGRKPSRKDFDFIRKPFFMIMLAATIAQSFAQYVPSIYLPSFGQDFGLSPSQGSLLSLMLNLAQAIGQPLQGHLADWQRSFYIPMLISTLGGTITVVCIWGFAKSLWSLIIFSFSFGVTSGGFAMLRPRFSAAIVGNDNNNEKSMLIFSILTACRGCAIIVCGFISTALVHDNYPPEHTYGGGKRYRDLLIYTAVLTFVASFGFVTKWIQPTTKIGRRGLERVRVERTDSEYSDPEMGLGKEAERTMSEQTEVEIGLEKEKARASDER